MMTPTDVSRISNSNILHKHFEGENNKVLSSVYNCLTHFEDGSLILNSENLTYLSYDIKKLKGDPHEINFLRLLIFQLDLIKYNMKEEKLFLLSLINNALQSFEQGKINDNIIIYCSHYILEPRRCVCNLVVICFELLARSFSEGYFIEMSIFINLIKKMGNLKGYRNLDKSILIPLIKKIIGLSQSGYKIDDKLILFLIRNLAIYLDDLPNESYFSNQKQFIELVKIYINNGGNPDIKFPKIRIAKHVYRDPTFFHLIYIYWKYPGIKLDKFMEKQFEEIIDQLLNDPRVDVRSLFSEEFLFNDAHFFKSKEFPNEISEKGYLLERMNIGHYAIVKKDWKMVDKILRKDPSLVNKLCCLTKGKNLLEEKENVVTLSTLTKDHTGKVILDYDDELGEIFSEENNFFNEYYKKLKKLDDDVAGEIAEVMVEKFEYEQEDDRDLTSKFGHSLILYCTVSRVAKVSFLHLAARTGNHEICNYLLGRGAKCISLDSDGLTPLNYLTLSLSEKLIKNNKYRDRLSEKLEPVERVDKSYLPRNFDIIEREGFLLFYDTIRKISSFAYERLTKNNLQKNCNRNGKRWKEDKEISALNRARPKDLKGSGYDIGHIVAAENTVNSVKAMEETFLMTNIWPQNRGLNRGYWLALEEYVRSKLQISDVVEVFTGCLFYHQIDPNGKKIVRYELVGEREVAVPTHFFKVIFTHNQTTSCEAYILPNEKINMSSRKSVLENIKSNFSCTVDRIQELSGIKFDQWRR